MELLIWLIAGILGLLAMGSTGYGTINDIICGIGGAFAGGFAGKFVGMWLFGLAGLPCPFGGPVGTIITGFTAFIGAVLVLAALRLLHSKAYRRHA